jgi:hypothetical protein
MGTESKKTLWKENLKDLLSLVTITVVRRKMKYILRSGSERYHQLWHACFEMQELISIILAM